MKILSSLLVSLGVFALQANALTDQARNSFREHMGEDRFIVVSQTQDLLARSLLREHDNLDHFGTHEDKVHFKVKPEAIKILEEGGVVFKDETKKFIEVNERNLQSIKFCEESDDECASKSKEEFYGKYQRWEVLMQRTDALAETSPLASIDSVGQSYEGRDLKSIWIGDQSKPLVFLTCNVHAREWIPPIYCVYLAETLLENGGHPILDQFSFIIVPSQNPDGYIFSYTESTIWRKTRKPNLGNPDCVGTDGNRNYGVLWGGDGASNDPCQDTYHGRTPYDQVEIESVRNFTMREDIKSRMIVFHDVHSYGSYLLYPWGGKFELPPEEDYFKLRTCSEAFKDAAFAATGESFTVGPSAATLYVAAGVAPDYYYQDLGVVFSGTIELRGGGLGGFAGFQPPVENIMLAATETTAALLAQLDCVADFEFSDDPPLPPTGSPTAACEDREPSGIFFNDGTPAECNVLGPYCSFYDFVRERCPVTCGTCDSFQVKTIARNDIRLIPIEAAAGINVVNQGSASVATVIAVTAGVVMVVATLLILFIKYRLQ